MASPPGQTRFDGVKTVIRPRRYGPRRRATMKTRPRSFMLAPLSDCAAIEPAAQIHAIGAAVSNHDVHGAFIDRATSRLPDAREQRLFRRMAARSGIAHGIGLAVQCS